MGEFIREAGWGIYPVLLFGGLSLVVALRYLASPRRSLFHLVTGLSLATGIAGVLGTATGIQATARFVAGATSGAHWSLFLVGLRESLCNLVAAFVILCVTCLLVTAGSYFGYRRREREERYSAEVKAATQ